MNVSYKWIIGFCIAFSFSVANAQAVHGVLRVVKGDVQIKSAKTGQMVKARVGEKVFPKDTIITAKDARAKIVMVDNNELNVSPESQIEIQNYEFDPAAGKKEVLLNVIYGKVRSKVEQKYDGKTSKFQIKTPSAVAGVRGTDFITAVNAPSMPNPGATNIVTFEGKVEFGTPGPNGGIQNPVAVTPGMTASNTVGAAPSAPVAVPKADLAKMDGDSKAEGPKGPAPGGANDQRAPSNEGGNKQDGAKGPGNGQGQGNGQGNGNGNGNDGGSGGNGANNGGPNGGPGGANSPGGRVPASTGGGNPPPPGGGGCTMCGPPDAGGGPNGPGPNFKPPEPPQAPPLPPQLPNIPQLPEGVKDATGGGPTKLKIIVNTPAQ